MGSRTTSTVPGNIALTETPARSGAPSGVISEDQVTYYRRTTSVVRGRANRNRDWYPTARSGSP